MKIETKRAYQEVYVILEQMPKEYVDKLVNNRFGSKLINFFNSIYGEDTDNINPLYDLDKKTNSC